MIDHMKSPSTVLVIFNFVGLVDSPFVFKFIHVRIHLYLFDSIYILDSATCKDNTDFKRKEETSTYHLTAKNCIHSFASSALISFYASVQFSFEVNRQPPTEYT